MKSAAYAQRAYGSVGAGLGRSEPSRDQHTTNGAIRQRSHQGDLGNRLLGGFPGTTRRGTRARLCARCGWAGCCGITNTDPQLRNGTGSSISTLLGSQVSSAGPPPSVVGRWKIQQVEDTALGMSNPVKMSKLLKT